MADARDLPESVEVLLSVVIIFLKIYALSQFCEHRISTKYYITTTLSFPATRKMSKGKQTVVRNLEVTELDNCKESKSYRQQFKEQEIRIQ